VDPKTTMAPLLVVVFVAPMIDVVPLTVGVIVMVKGGGCIELLRVMSPVVLLESRVTPQTGIAVVVTSVLN
jgi:hypothetical protein